MDGIDVCDSDKWPTGRGQALSALRFQSRAVWFRRAQELDAGPGRHGTTVFVLFCFASQKLSHQPWIDSKEQLLPSKAERTHTDWQRTQE
jgi:hypothetical protein